MKKSEILKRAKQRIASSASHYICDAVGTVSEYRHEGDELKDWISGLIEDRFSYQYWLEETHPKFYEQHVQQDRYHGIDGAGENEACREGRLQWLDWMIAYWQERGQ